MQTYDRSSTLTEIATPDYLGYENVDMDFLVILLTLFKGRLEVEVEWENNMHRPKRKYETSENV